MYDVKPFLKENIFVSFVDEEESCNILNCFLAYLIIS
jgi:hypothetical protein